MLCSWAHIHKCPRKNTCACQAQCKHGSAGEVLRGGWSAERLSSVGNREALVDAGFETQQDFSFLFSLLFLFSLSFPLVFLFSSSFSLPRFLPPPLVGHWNYRYNHSFLSLPIFREAGTVLCTDHVHQASWPRNFPSCYRNSEATDMCHLIQLLMWISDTEHCKSGLDFFPTEPSPSTLCESECIISNILSLHSLILFLFD